MGKQAKIREKRRLKKQLFGPPIEMPDGGAAEDVALEILEGAVEELADLYAYTDPKFSVALEHERKAGHELTASTLARIAHAAGRVDLARALLEALPPPRTEDG